MIVFFFPFLAGLAFGYLAKGVVDSKKGGA